MDGKIIKSPDVHNYTDWLGRINYRLYGDDTTYDEKSYMIIDEIFDLLEKFAPINDNGIRELWLTSDRGTIEDFGDFEEMRSWGDVDTYEEFETLWHDYYPNEIQWYHMTAVNDKDTAYKAILIDHRQVIEVDRQKKHEGLERNIKEYALWLLDAVRKCYEQVKAGTYNERINRELPPEYRTGTIIRKAYCDIFPEYRKDFLMDISKEEIDEFVKAVSELPEQDDMPRISEFTANEFYKCCALGYNANNYEFSDLSPKEQYYKHADGRDSGLKDIDGDSVEALIVWLLGHHSGHPWEVCRGGNSTHIDLYIHYDEKGFYLAVRGNAETRCVEAVKFFLAIRAAGYPVYIYDGKELSDRFRETEKIGIVPKGVFPRYCSTLFQNENVIDYMNLPFEKRGEVAKACEWQPLNEVRLINE